MERAIRYIRTSFFAARSFRDIADLNSQARTWCLDVSSARRWQDDDRTSVGAQFQEERKLLRPLPDNPHEAAERIKARVGRTPYVRFDTNDYSLPSTHVRQTVTVLAEPQRIRIAADGEVVADHPRSFDRRAVIEDPEHVRQLVDDKRRARQGAGMNRLTRSVPPAQLMLTRAAQRGHNLGSLVAKLLELLDIYGAQAMAAAVSDANAQDRVGPGPVRVAVEAMLRSRGKEPPRPVPISDPRLREITVTQADLATYDQLTEQDTDHVDTK